MTRVVLAMMKHETNTFSPVPTDLARFAKGAERPIEGEAVLAAYRGTGSCMAGFIDVAEAAGAELVPSIAASAPPSGPVQSAAYEHICDAILATVAGGCDAILLDLHGAMVTERHEDGEGELLVRIRAIAPDVPIGVTLDMHANLYPAMTDNADVVAGYQTYPHIDYHETGVRAARPIFAMLRGEARPVTVWGNRPMLPHVMRQGSGDFPNRELQGKAREMEEEGALAVSLFTGFPHADISNAGLSCVVVTDGDRAAAEEMRDELLDFAWTNRDAFVYRIEPLADSIARARDAADGAGAEGAAAPHPAARGDGPVILLDHYDNAASGGTMDSMTVLGAIAEAELDDVAVFAIHDPGAVRELIAAGIGAETTVMLGGKIDMPAIGMAGEPLEVTGRVKLISEGRFRNLGPAGTGIEMNMGPTVVLDTGRVEIVVISRHHEPNDLNCFLSLGIDPGKRRFLMLKSRIHYRAGFADIARDVLECAGTGVCTSDYDMLDFRNVRRPIYPLDRINEP
ncbi:MAG: M81 family metallopeptidase [Immundisolibacterales bacterium]|nr:M81 family metallopeptidase [Immundisolibacterales bacterium]